MTSENQLARPVATAATGPASAGTRPGFLLPMRRFAVIYIALILAMLLSSLDQMVFATALPTIASDLNGVSELSWVTTAYLLAATIMLPIYGKLGDLIGRRALLIGGIGIFVAGSLVGAFATDMTWLIVGRAVQGIGGGGLMMLSQATVADIVPPKERGKWLGPVAAVFGVATVLGPILGGWFADSIGWRWAFWINVPFGVVALIAVAVFLRIPRPQVAKIRFDYLGTVLLAASVTSFVLFTSWGGEKYVWGSPTILTLIAVAVVAFGLLLLVERKAAEPILPLRVFRVGNFNFATAAALLSFVVIYGATTYPPTYLQVVHHQASGSSGLLVLPMMLGMAASGVAAGQIASRATRYKWLPLAGALLAAAAWGMSTLTVDSPVWWAGVLSGVLGVGIGAGFQLYVLIVQNSFSLREVGTVTAANNFFRQIGGTLGTAIVGGVFVSRLTDLLTTRLAGAAGGGGGFQLDGLSPQAIWALPEPVRGVIVTSYNDAITPIFLALVPVLIAAFLLTLGIKEIPLKEDLEYAETETEVTQAS